MSSDLTVKRLKELYNYDPETGVFTRKVKSGNGLLPGSVAGSPKGNGYLRIQIDGKAYQCHRLAWLYMYGVWPENQIDHINQVRDDNRISNLRDVTPSQNSRNTKLSENNSSGAKGVYYEGSKGYSARIWFDGKSKRLGLFHTFEEAVEARKAAEAELGFHVNHGSVPEESANAIQR